MTLKPKLKKSIDRLLEYCKKNNWKGYDPYDGLSSKVFNATPFKKYKIPRLAFIQFMKRCPFNLRNVLLVPKEQNPKAIALFVSALIKLSEEELLNESDMVDQLVNKLIFLRSNGYSLPSWGYNFDWQNKAFFLPKYSPNIICTTFAANALLDYYKRFQRADCLDMAVSAGEFLLTVLNISKTGDGICFSYTPFDKGKVHNANLLGAALLARLYRVTGDKSFLEPALLAAKYSVSCQNRDGSWMYGESKTQQWIDGFHTGYNLVALRRFSKYSEIENFDQNIKQGFHFYLNHFFTEDGITRYYNNRMYPIDIHSIAQAMITLVECWELNENALELAEKVFSWAVDHMQSPKGYFYFQKKLFFTNRISYMRWSQAWMLYALAAFGGFNKIKHF